MPPDGAPAPTIVARGLTRRYGPRRALDGVDLRVEEGDFITLFGPNGAGKTTLLKTLATLIRPGAGSLSIFGIDPRRDPDAVKRRLGLIGHSGFVYDGLTGRDNLIFFARLYDVADPERCADDLLDRVGLTARADDPVRAYSRGMRQRLSIARALVNAPDLVLLDEPYTGLDPHASRMLRDLLEQIRGSRRTVVMVTHQIEEGLWLSNRIGVMAHGRIVHEQPAAGVSRETMERTYHDLIGGTA